MGTDFVGRMNLPLVAIGEQFTAGFGVDPQLQVQRRLVEKARSTQGGNQVLKYEYRILVNSYKSVREERPKNLLRWDLTAEPEKNGEKALTIRYEFKLELDRQMLISNVLTK